MTIIFRVKITHQRCVLDVLATMLRNPRKELSIENQIGDISVCGHVITTPEIHKTAVRKNGEFGSLHQSGILLGCIKVKISNILFFK